jgi:hypothetical protein
LENAVEGWKQGDEKECGRDHIRLRIMLMKIVRTKPTTMLPIS